MDGVENEFAAMAVADGPIPKSAETEMTRIRWEILDSSGVSLEQKSLIQIFRIMMCLLC